MYNPEIKKPKFDPSKKFVEVNEKPPFDPNANFEDAEQPIKKKVGLEDGGQVGTSVPQSDEDKPVDVSKLRNISSFKGGLSDQDKTDIKNYAIATDKEHKAKVNDAINTTTDLYRAATKFHTGKENEFQNDVPREQQGEYVNNFLNNPNVIERAKTDPAFAKQYKEAKFNQVNDFPETAQKNIVQKIGQHLEDNGQTSILYNNPSKEKVDKAVDDLVASGDLNQHEAYKYKQDIRPEVGTTKSMLFGSPIPTSDYVNTISKSLERSGGNIVEGMRDAADKLSGGAISAFGENRAAHQKRVLNDIYSQPQIESKASEGNKFGMNVADMVGFALPAVLGEMAGIPTMATLGTQFYGQNKKDGMVAFPENENKQDAYAALTTGIDLIAGEKLPIKGLGESIRGLVDDAAAGKISQAAAKNKYLEFITDTFKGGIKGANALEVMKVGHNAANAVFGGSDFNVVDQAKKVLSDYPQDALGMALFSGIHAATKSRGEVGELPTETPQPKEELPNETTIEHPQPIENTESVKKEETTPIEKVPDENIETAVKPETKTTSVILPEENNHPEIVPLKKEAEVKEEESPKIKELQDKKAKLIEQRDNPPTRNVIETNDEGEATGKVIQKPLKEADLNKHVEAKNAEIEKVDAQIEKQKTLETTKPKLDDLPFLKAEDFDKAKNSDHMDELVGKQKEVKKQFKNLRKITECIWAI